MEIFSFLRPRSRLLDLPTELREYIFSLVVTSEKPIIAAELDKYQAESYEQASQPSITKVSRQIRREALPLYFERNEIIMYTDGDKYRGAQNWLQDNQSHLSKLWRLALWVRYQDLESGISHSSGIISVHLRHDPRLGRWVVDDKWRWITVVRKPADAEEDGVTLGQLLTKLVNKRSRAKLTVEDYREIMFSLQVEYHTVKEERLKARLSE
jgi:hypothetical protein